jgi:predicted metal-dependent hydrolase
MSAHFPHSLLRFAELFNRDAFWESHEVLERPWREARSGFYKGLILLASAWVHVQRGNPKGIEAQLRKAVRQLEAYRPAYLGVDVDGVLAHAEAALGAVARYRGAEWHRWESLLPPPRLSLEPARVRGDEPELDGG